MIFSLTPGLAGILAAALMITALGAALAEEQMKDRHAGYYYPPTTSSETYEARATTIPIPTARNASNLSTI